jgi:hypothetical protein
MGAPLSSWFRAIATENPMIITNSRHVRMIHMDRDTHFTLLLMGGSIGISTWTCIM